MMSNSQVSKIEKEEDSFFFRVSSEELKKISGNPIAYWVGDDVRNVFSKGIELSKLFKPVQGLITGDTDKFAKVWHEVSGNKTQLAPSSKKDAVASGKKWFPYNKGGSFRKWYGNNEFIVNWENNGTEIKNFKDIKGKLLSRPQNEATYFREGLTWTAISSSNFAVRYCPEGSIGSNAGMMVFSDNPSELKSLLGLLNSSVATYLMSCLSQTLNFDQGIISRVPIMGSQSSLLVNQLIELESTDWNSYETSWDFTRLPLLDPDYCPPIVKVAYENLRAHWQEMTLEMKRLEQENNRIFIDAYGLQDELEPDVPLKEITLTCNPHYRYGGDKSEEELEALLLADTMREFVSYAVGCMFGRYALEKEGLVLANQGETIEDYLKQIPQPSFPADDDNVIPMLDGDWFTDDITERFRQFLKLTFGEEHYEDNLRYVEQGLNIKGKRNYSIRDYFLKEFYDDHVRRYKKRPIYWLFSSPKGSFNALIYMHRYQSHTVGTVLEYLRDFQDKLKSSKDRLESLSIKADISSGEKTKALKEIEKINKMLVELEEYERDVLYPLATEQIEIDLDDGVKANYPQFGNALKKITGLS